MKKKLLIVVIPIFLIPTLLISTAYSNGSDNPEPAEMTAVPESTLIPLEGTPMPKLVFKSVVADVQHISNIPRLIRIEGSAKLHHACNVTIINCSTNDYESFENIILTVSLNSPQAIYSIYLCEETDVAGITQGVLEIEANLVNSGGVEKALVQMHLYLNDTDIISLDNQCLTSSGEVPSRLNYKNWIKVSESRSIKPLWWSSFDQRISLSGDFLEAKANVYFDSAPISKIFLPTVIQP